MPKITQKLLDQVRHCLVAHAGVQPGERLVVAVSGGADSVALLHLLAALADLSLQLVLVHLNHCLRGAESDGDERFVRELAAMLDLPLVVRRVDVQELSSSQRLSLEEAGREARYGFFREVAQSHGARLVALAHHLDDQAETVLLRLLRGAGGEGLGAMRPLSADGTLVRPLLGASRREIEAYLRHQALAWRNDSSNADQSFLRNRLRHELLPLLKGYNPAIVERLSVTAETLAADETVLERVTDAAFGCWGRVEQGRVVLDRSGVSREEAGIRLRLYRRAIRLLQGDLRRIGYRHLQAIDHLVLGERANARLQLPAGVQVTGSYRTLRFSMVTAVDEWQDYDLLIDGLGSYPLPGSGLLTIVPATPDAAGAGAGVLLDGRAWPFPWQVRPYRPGDRFIPSGMTGRKKVKDFFIDRKIPLDERRRVPLLCCGHTILWLCGMRLAEPARPDPDSPLLLLASFVPDA